MHHKSTRPSDTVEKREPLSPVKFAGGDELPMTNPPQKLAEISIPEQKTLEGLSFPAVVGPRPGHSADLSSLVDAVVGGGRAWLESLLHVSGAVLLRGFHVEDAYGFNVVVEAFGYDELPYVGGAAPRSNVVGRVFTANESPPDQKIPFHHEMAQVPEYPAKLFFFCEVPPASGGETPIALSHRVYDKMKERHPKFVGKLELDGLKYVRILGAGDDPSSPIGRGWQSTFLTDDRAVAERNWNNRAKRLGMELEWSAEEDGVVKTVMGPIPGVKVDEARNRKVWFNSMVAAYTGWKDGRNDPSKAVAFGDGSPLPAGVVLDCLKVLEDECVAFSWKKGDILLIDNMAVLHSRRSFEPPRRILASLCK